MARAKQSFVGGTLKLVAGSLSAGGALVSILSYASAYTTPPAASLVHKLVVTPARDTARSLGDSLQLAALVTDARGAGMLGVAPSWTSADPGIAAVDQAGTVVSRSPGTTSIIVRVGELEARARIAVVQRPAELQLGDTALLVPEGERRRVLVEVGDARGNAILGAQVRWEIADPAIAAVDSGGQVSGVSPGRTGLTVTHGSLRAAFPVEVVPVPASITIAAGEDQRAAAGTTLATPVSAQVVSRSGRPIAGVPASFLIRGGLGSTVPAVDTSDAKGMVQATWTLGAIPGRQQLAISVDGVPVSPVLTAEADPLPANTRVVAVMEGLVGPAGDSLADPVLVRVTDSAGRALADLPVAWSTGDGGKVVSVGARTDSLGEARAHWTLGPKAGVQRMRVQVGNPRLLSPLIFTGKALPGPAIATKVRGGNRQSGTAGKPLAQPVLFEVVDRHGNGISGASILVEATAGRVSDSVVATDSAGQAKVRWTLGREAGAQRLTARMARSDTTVEVTARARPAAPARLVFVAPVTTGTAGQELPNPVVVEVTDTYGNSVPGRSVTFTATSGKIAPARAVTDSVGRAALKWTLGAKAGLALLAAKVGGTEVKGHLPLSVKAKPRRAP